MHKTCSISYGHLADLQKKLPTTDLNKNTFHLIKYPIRLLFFPIFSICTCIFILLGQYLFWSTCFCWYLQRKCDRFLTKANFRWHIVDSVTKANFRWHIVDSVTVFCEPWPGSAVFSDRLRFVQFRYVKCPVTPCFFQMLFQTHHFYLRLSNSKDTSLCPPVTPSVCTSASYAFLAIFLSTYHLVSMVITTDKCAVHANGQGTCMRSEVKANFAPIEVFPDCYPSLNSTMVMKWCIKLEVA